MLLLVQILSFSFVYLFHYVSTTEVTVYVNTTDRSLGTDIDIPVLICHVRHIAYKEILWYKDNTLLRKGSAEMQDHVLPLASLLNRTSPPIFEHPLKLQGYYWCKTDNNSFPFIHRYLFRINKEIHTYAGILVATRDSVESHDELNLKEAEKIFEYEMEKELFPFLPPPSVSVTNINKLQKGFQIRFYLYERQVFHPRTPNDDEFQIDYINLDYVLDNLNKRLSIVDKILNGSKILNDSRGVQIQKIHLKSTLGCYEEMSPMQNSDEEILWPSARIGEIVIPENACSSNNGLAVTRMCTGSFDTGATWGNPSGICAKQAEGITRELKKLYDDYGMERSHYIQKLVNLTKYPSNLRVTDLHIIAEILLKLSYETALNEKEINGIVSAIDNLMETNKTELNDAKRIIRLSSRILQVFDNIFESASKEGKKIRVSKRHTLVDTKYMNTTEHNDHVLGFAVTTPNKSHSLKDGFIEIILSSDKVPKHESIAYFSLPEDLVLKKESKFPYLVNIVFFQEQDLFQAPEGLSTEKDYKVLPTSALYVSISGEPEWNRTDPLQLYFKDTTGVEIENPRCVYYNIQLEGGAGAWSSEGCEYGGFRNGFHNCRCHHLSTFAVVLSQRLESPGKLKLGTSVYVGCGVSILALSFAILLFILSKNWRLTTDHKILFCLILTFLACIILIFISELHFLWTPGCMVLALSFHYTVFAIFGWLLVHAVIYQLRFAKKTDVTEIPHFMIKAILSVWGAPIIIMMLIWLLKDFSPPGKDNCWLTVSEVSKVSVIPIVTLLLVTMCVNMCATYALTCRFKKDFLVGESTYAEPVIKFRVSFTIFLFFVMSWIFGFFALHERSTELRILFSISITLTAYYVTLFFVFQELSFWDLCRRCMGTNEEPPIREKKLPDVKYEAKRYKSTDDYDDVK